MFPWLKGSHIFGTNEFGGISKVATHQVIRTPAKKRKPLQQQRAGLSHELVKWDDGAKPCSSLERLVLINWISM